MNSANQCWSILRKIRAAPGGGRWTSHPQVFPRRRWPCFRMHRVPSAACRMCWLHVCARTHSLDDDYCLNWTEPAPPAHTFGIIFKTAARTPAPPRRTPIYIPAFGYICVHAINLNNRAVHVPRRQSIHSPWWSKSKAPVRIGASRRRVCSAGLRGQRESGAILQAN